MTHRVPDGIVNMADKLDVGYLADVERMTARREMKWDSAQNSLAKAERRLKNVHAKAIDAKTKRERESAKKQHAAAWDIVQARRDELAILNRLMTATPAGTLHRGTSSYRKAPVRHGPLF